MRAQEGQLFASHRTIFRGWLQPVDAVARTAQIRLQDKCRSEALLGDNDGRDQVIEQAELALAADGQFLALRWAGMHKGAPILRAQGRSRSSFRLSSPLESTTSRRSL
jgi:hypothetical protein